MDPVGHGRAVYKDNFPKPEKSTGDDISNLTLKHSPKHRVTIPCKGLSISHEIRMKSGGFHEIHPKPCKIRRVFAETSDFMVKSARFHGFHEIRRIS